MNKNEVIKLHNLEGKEKDNPKFMNNVEKESNKSNPQVNPNTRTLIAKNCSKSLKNAHLFFTILIIIFIYYFYMKWNLVFILSKSKAGLDYKFWKAENLEDKQYLKSLIYFIIFHILFLLLLVSFYKTVLTQPGGLLKEYIKVFSLRSGFQGNVGAYNSSIDGASLSNSELTDEELKQIFASDDSKSKDN